MEKYAHVTLVFLGADSCFFNIRIIVHVETNAEVEKREKES